MTDETLTMECGRCGKEWPDLDGFGVLYCPAWAGGCGYCAHASISDGICGFCGQPEGKEGSP